jgi:hypothetical protein
MLAADSSKTLFNSPDRTDYLSFREIESQYPGCIAAGTLALWASTHRYNFHLIVTKIGRNSRVRRDRWEKFLDSRTIGERREVL